MAFSQVRDLGSHDRQQLSGGKAMAVYVWESAAGLMMRLFGSEGRAVSVVDAHGAVGDRVRVGSAVVYVKEETS